MSNDTTEECLTEFEHHIEVAKSVFEAKYKARGGDNITRQSLPGVIDRIRYDKLARFSKVSTELMLHRNMHGRIECGAMGRIFEAAGINTDDVIDDLYDIANYAIMAIMLIEGTWE